MRWIWVAGKKNLCQRVSDIHQGLQRRAALAMMENVPSEEKKSWKQSIMYGRCFKVDSICAANFVTLTEAGSIWAIDQKKKKVVISRAVYVHNVKNSNVGVRLADNVIDQVGKLVHGSVNPQLNYLPCLKCIGWATLEILSLSWHIWK